MAMVSHLHHLFNPAMCQAFYVATVVKLFVGTFLRIETSGSRTWRLRIMFRDLSQVVASSDSAGYKPSKSVFNPSLAQVGLYLSARSRFTPRFSTSVLF